VDHRIDGVGLEQLAQRCLVADVGAVEGEQLAPAISSTRRGLGLAVAEVIDDDHLVARAKEFDAGMGADVAGAAGHEEW
jgi:hypothetical protein